jgi:hypothetical protein
MRRLICRLIGHEWYWEDTVVDRLHLDGEMAAQAAYRCDQCARCRAQRCTPIDSLFRVPREPSRADLLARASPPSRR